MPSVTEIALHWRWPLIRKAVIRLTIIALEKKTKKRNRQLEAFDFIIKGFSELVPGIE